jgi:cation transport regulator ChaB
MPIDEEDLPGTLQRSPKKAQRTYAKALDSAHEQCDDEQRAHQVAYAALKHSFEKVGDHWEPKKPRRSLTIRDDGRRAARQGSAGCAGRERV